MSDDRHPRPPEGAMTEATGSLTPEERDEEFVPAERRAIESPEDAHALSRGARRRRTAEGAPADEPGSLERRSLEELAPNERDGGYGSEHGLAADDRAYDFEERAPTAGAQTRASQHEDGEERQATEDSP
jgi:hypothetical protein